MQVTFPAMRGTIGQREYFATIISLSEIPHLFKFNDWAECTPELRAQRVLNEPRVPEIVHYILDNEDGYLFSSITASYDSSSGIKFIPSSDREDIGKIEMELENAQFIINDGQHRCAAIAQALKQNPALGKEKISILLFPMEDLHRLQQMFSDLNRFAHKTSKSLNILYDHRDTLTALTMQVAEEVDVFRGMVDKESITIPVRSPKLFTLSTLYDAHREMFGSSIEKKDSHEYQRAVQKAIDYWNEIVMVIPDWKRVKSGEMQATQLRQEKISAHAVVVRALGGLARSLMERCPDTWRQYLQSLIEVDWRKAKGSKVNPQWERVCIVAGSVVSNRQARAATLETLKQLAGINLPTGPVQTQATGKLQKDSKEKSQAVASNR